MVYSVQVKRLRNESPLEALIVRGTKRRHGDFDDSFAPKDIVFKLSQTYSTDQSSHHTALAANTAEHDTNEHVFSLSQAKRVKKNSGAVAASSSGLHQSSEQAAGLKDQSNDELPPELASMIAEYIGPENPAFNSQDIDKETEDYVYDVYFSEQAGPLASTRVGYIDINEGEEKLLFPDSEDEAGLSDDEDSNAEDFYANEYPDESESELLSSFEEDSAPEIGDLRLDDLSEEDDPDYMEKKYGWH